MRARIPSEDHALWLLYAFTAVALIGYATFGLNPGLVTRVPAVAPFYGRSFGFFAQGQIWLSAVVLAYCLTRRSGGHWLPAFAALYLISLASELIGTSRGIPFGEYAYTGALGPKWAGAVPVSIPVSWFYMAVPSYALALRALPAHRPAAARIAFASLILVCWDLALDPAMSRATAYWVWEADGRYYGMPAINLFGWYVTGLALMAALAALDADRWIYGLRAPWLAGFYGANLLLPLGIAAAAGLWLAVAATAAGLLLCGALALAAQRRSAARTAARAAAR